MDSVFQIKDSNDVLPMWIADMDFSSPPAVKDALQQRLAHSIFGYSLMCDSCRKVVVDWQVKRHRWRIDSEDLLFYQGVIPAIAAVIEAFTKKGGRGTRHYTCLSSVFQLTLA